MAQSINMRNRYEINKSDQATSQRYRSIQYETNHDSDTSLETDVIQPKYSTTDHVLDQVL